MDSCLLHCFCALLQHGFARSTHLQIDHPWRHVVEQGRNFGFLRTEVESVRHSPVNIGVIDVNPFGAILNAMSPSPFL